MSECKKETTPMLFMKCYERLFLQKNVSLKLVVSKHSCLPRSTDPSSVDFLVLWRDLKNCERFLL